MTHHLVSFIGKSADYREMHYRFSGWTTDHQYKLFGLALVSFFRRSGSEETPPIDRVVFVGTAGSSFDTLSALVGCPPDGVATVNQNLRRAGQSGRLEVVQCHANHLAPHLSEVLGLPCALRVIPDAAAQETQIEAVKLIAAGIEPDDLVTLDVTHGLRHLPMLALTTALLLRHARKAKVAGIWYGAKDLVGPREPAPAVDLAGLLEVANWVSAFAIFEHSRDFGPFADRLEAAGMAEHAVELLREASFLERATRLESLQQALAKFDFAAGTGWPGLAGLFERPVKGRLSEVSDSDLYAQQRSLALLNAKAGDPLRAVLFAYEALVTLLALRERSDPRRHDIRERINKSLSEPSTLAREISKDHNWINSVILLKDLRNKLAHADQLLFGKRGGKVSDRLHSHAKFSNEIRRLIGTLLPKQR